MMPVYCFLLAWLLDLLLGDPHWMPHPVRLIGWTISFLEKGVRSIFPQTPKGELAGGTLLWALVCLLSFGLPALLLAVCYRLSFWIGLAVEIFLTSQLFAARSLREESMAVFYPLREKNLPKAREMVSRIVGRDPQSLSLEGVTKAAVETVAENASDGVIAPMFWTALGGLPLGMLYKAVNTMDSMLGYKNDRYLFFGRTAAKADDLANFLPARICGELLLLACPLQGYSYRQARAVYKRDRRKHSSPNAAFPESACAGALGIQLAGPNYYGGKLVDKPALGDFLRPVEAEDIPRVNRLMLTASLLFLPLCLLLRRGIFVWLGGM